MAARIFIDGEAGTTGLQIGERLRRIAGIEPIGLEERLRKDPSARLAAMRRADLVVLCLPDEAARQAVAMVDSLGAAAPRLLDASTAHRLAPGWVYGFAELCAGQAEAIAAASRVANPGCYATGAIALLRPLADAGLLAAEVAVSINAISGYSGGGRPMIAAHEAAGGPAFRLYALSLDHKHLPEIMRHARLGRLPVFVPSVGHFRQGMLVSVPIAASQLENCPPAAELVRLYAAHYRGSAQICVRHGVDSGELDPQALNGTDGLEIFVCGGAEQTLLIARLDNLGKGAAGAAVQNIALMLGLPEPVAAQPRKALEDA